MGKFATSAKKNIVAGVKGSLLPQARFGSVSLTVVVPGESLTLCVIVAVL